MWKGVAEGGGGGDGWPNQLSMSIHYYQFSWFSDHDFGIELKCEFHSFPSMQSNFQPKWGNMG